MRKPMLLRRFDVHDHAVRLLRIVVISPSTVLHNEPVSHVRTHGRRGIKDHTVILPAIHCLHLTQEETMGKLDS